MEGPPHVDDRDRLHRGQPEREKRGKRGAQIDAPGFDAGKLIKGRKRHILVDTEGLHARTGDTGQRARTSGHPAA